MLSQISVRKFEVLARYLPTICCLLHSQDSQSKIENAPTNHFQAMRYPSGHSSTFHIGDDASA